MTLKIIAESGREDLSRVYVGETGDGRVVEFVESLQPPLPRERKWVLIVSSLFGCPVQCPMCDANDHYKGKLSSRQILDQIDYMIRRRYPDGVVPVPKLKVQFARMGEPSFNDNILDALDALPRLYDAPGLLPCLSTVAPEGRDGFFARLKELKDRHYSNGRFQLQFSIHTTDTARRDALIPVRKWDLAKIAEYGRWFFEEGDRKVTLNFAAIQGAPIEPKALAGHFDKDRFLVKLTPLNPTHSAARNAMQSSIDPFDPDTAAALADAFKREGFEVIVSIGEVDENAIGSNCGQFVSALAAGSGCGRP